MISFVTSLLGLLHEHEHFPQNHIIADIVILVRKFRKVLCQLFIIDTCAVIRA